MLEPVDLPADPPALYLYLTDIPRAGIEYGQLLTVLPLQRLLPVGDGHPVLVLPGLLAGDGSTWILRRILRRLGYRAHGWRLGRNVGPTANAVAGMADRLEKLHNRYDAPVSLIGWSLGGIFARTLARRHPSAVRQVITLGSPFGMTDASESRATPSFKRYQHLHVVAHELPLPMESDPLPVPATAVYSRCDGIVAWRACMNPIRACRKHRGAEQSHRLRPPSGRGLGHRRSAGPAAGRVGAVPAPNGAAAAVSATGHPARAKGGDRSAHAPQPGLATG
jgi:pimeloyl-ACP methyl ester carboxylesterase